MAGRTAPLAWGTVTFVCMWFVMYVLGFVFVSTKKLSRPDRSLYSVFITIAAVCMWMMWAMIWMSQLNPILYPEGPPHVESHRIL